MKKNLSSMQLKFLRFALRSPIYINGSVRIDPTLPATGAVAKTIADSLHRRGFITPGGNITLDGKAALSAETRIEHI